MQQCYNLGMKVVKLNRRYKMFKEHGHTIALRFNEFNRNAVVIEDICKAKFKTSKWNAQGPWHGRFGSRPDSFSPRPYWISFRDEADLTFVLLSADLTK